MVNIMAQGLSTPDPSLSIPRGIYFKYLLFDPLLHVFKLIGEGYSSLIMVKR